MIRPRIKRTTEPISVPDGDLFLMWPSAGIDIRIEQPTGEQRSLLEALDGSHSITQLNERFGAEEVATTISQLQQLGAIEDAADDELIPEAERERFDRQLRYFSDIGGGLLPSECQARLRDAKVAVLGVGGLGGAAALWLATVGVGEIWLLDGDRVEPSNLNRQVLYSPSDFDLLKVEVAAARLRTFNPMMRVTSEARRLGSQEEIADFIDGADVLVDAADWPAHDIERWCNQACFEAGIPFITMSHFPPIARVGPFFIPGRTGCYACQETALKREYPLYEVTVDQRRAKASPAATLGPACGMIAAQIALEVMHFLTGLVDPVTLGTAHITDLRTMEVTHEVIAPELDCPVCGHLQPTAHAGRRAM